MSKSSIFAKVILLASAWMLALGAGAVQPLSRIDITNEVYTAAETEQKIVELAPAPGDYAAVSNAAMNARSLTDLAVRGVPQGKGSWFTVDNSIYSWTQSGNWHFIDNPEDNYIEPYEDGFRLHGAGLVTEKFVLNSHYEANPELFTGEYLSVVGYTDTIAQVSQIPSSFDNITDGPNMIDAAGNVYSLRSVLTTNYYNSTFGKMTLTIMERPDSDGIGGYANWDGGGASLYVMSSSWALQVGDENYLGPNAPFDSQSITINGMKFERAVELVKTETNLVGRLALTDEIPQVVAPSTNATAGTAADARATGTALYTGFTEWTTSPPESSVRWLEIGETVVGWVIMYGQVETAVIEPDGTDPNATSVSANINGTLCIATRHLVTPTKTSQLTNNGTNGVPFALTTDIPQVVSPSTNAVAGTAADAKAVGTAIYTGFTEWEFSGAVQPNEHYNIIIDEVDGLYAYNLDNGIDVIGYMTGQLDPQPLMIDFSNASSISTNIIATRHLVTPTMTSQLANNGDGTFPFATTNQLPDIMLKTVYGGDGDMFSEWALYGLMEGVTVTNGPRYSVGESYYYLNTNDGLRWISQLCYENESPLFFHQADSSAEPPYEVTAKRKPKVGYVFGNQTNKVLAVTNNIPLVVSPSTNATLGTAADAKVTGVALYTGFTEWEFSGVPSGWIVTAITSSSEDMWELDLLEPDPAQTTHIATCGGSIDSIELVFVDPLDGEYTVTATRHLVTPTKTSQLDNNGDGISPFSTTQYVDRATLQMWIDTSTTPATTNFNQNFVPLFHNGTGLDAVPGNGYYGDSEDEYETLRVYNTAYGILLKDPSQTTYNRADRQPNFMWGVNLEPLGFSFNLGKTNKTLTYTYWGAGENGDTYSEYTDLSVVSWTNLMIASQPLPYIERPTILNNHIANERTYIKTPVSSMAVLHGLRSGWVNGHRLYTEGEKVEGSEYHYYTTIVGTDIPQTTNANAVSVGTRLANVLDDRVVLSSNSWRQTDGAYVMKPIAFTAMGADGVLWGNDDANQYILLYQNTTYHYLTNKPSTSPSAYSVATFAGTSDSTEIDFGEYGKFRRTSLTDTETIHSIYSDQLSTAIDGIATNIADGTFKAKRIYTDDGMMYLDATGVLSRVTFNLGETLTMSNVFGEAGVTVTYTNIPNAQIPAYLVLNPTGIHADEIKDYMGLVAWSSAQTNWLGFADSTTVAELIANYGADLSGAMNIDFTSRYATSPETTEFEFGIYNRYWPAYIPQGSTASEAVNSVVFSKGNAKIEGSLAQGYGNVASGQFAHAEGTNTTASGRFAHAEGNNTEATGWQAHSEGYMTKASGGSSHAGGSGEGTRADGEEYVGASGLYSFTMGLRCNATNIASFAQGSDTAALGKSSHSEGYRTTAKGNFSHAEGLDTDADGEASFAGGKNAKATHNRSFVWQGNNPPGGDTSWRYESKNAGTFNINPVGGIAGFFIGDSNLPTTFYNAITSSTPIEVRMERDNADGTTTTFTTNMPPIREAVENVSVAALLKPSSALEGWSLPEYISVLKKYEWDSKAQVCYRREVTNDYIILKAVTNIDLTAAGNLPALKAYEDSIAVRRPPQVTSGYTVGYESDSGKIVLAGGDYVLEGNNLSGASVRITYEVSGTPTTETIPDASITTTIDTITIASSALANARSNGGTVTFAIQTPYGSTTATAVVASVSP